MPERAELTSLNAYLLLFVPEISLIKSAGTIREGFGVGKPNRYCARAPATVPLVFFRTTCPQPFFPSPNAPIANSNHATMKATPPTGTRWTRKRIPVASHA